MADEDEEAKKNYFNATQNIIIGLMIKNLIA